MRGIWSCVRKRKKEGFWCKRELTSFFSQGTIEIKSINLYYNCMRSIMNISLPTRMAEKVKKEVRSGRYATVSEFFRELVRGWEEDRVFRELKESQKEIVQGKGKVLRSLKDLR